MNSLQACLEGVHQGIARAAVHAGRAVEDITLVCVSKGVALECILEAIALGEFHFGENRVDELADKHDNVGRDCDFHFIGQLQTNKVRQLMGKVALVHSLDRLSLAEELERQGRLRGVVTQALIQIDLYKKEGRAGVSGLEEGKRLLEAVFRMEHVHLRGVMNIAPLGVSDAVIRENFRQVCEMFTKLRGWTGNGDFDILSMGMSQDYSHAIMEGATMVRIGSAIFDGWKN